MKIFSGTANEDLAYKICENMNTRLGSVRHKTFASGEKYCQFQENIRGDDVFLIQPTSAPANDNLMELMLMADAAKRASAGKITAVVTYFGYGRQDRKDKSRVPISAKLVMDMLSLRFDRVVTMDLHAAQVGGFTNLPFDHLSFKPSLLKSLIDNRVNIDVVVSPDIGAVKRAQEYSKVLRKPMAIIAKERLSDTEVEVVSFIGNVKGKDILIVDDLTESCNTLVEAAKTCKKEGAKEVNIAVTHGCLSDLGKGNLVEAIYSKTFSKFFTSNTIHWESGLSNVSNLIKVDVAPVFATAIERIHNNESVSELFSTETPEVK